MLPRSGFSEARTTGATDRIPGATDRIPGASVVKLGLSSQRRFVTRTGVREPVRVRAASKKEGALGGAARRGVGAGGGAVRVLTPAGDGDQAARRIDRGA